MRVIETSDWRDAPHFHALIGGVNKVKPYEVEKLWFPNGLAKVKRYNPNLGGAYYISTSYESMEFSKNFPPLESN